MKIISFCKNTMNKNRMIVLFGGGIYGELVLRVINELYGGEVGAVVDNKMRELPWTTLPVMRSADLSQFHNADIIICGAGSFENIYNIIQKSVDDTCEVFDAIKILEDFKSGVEKQIVSVENHFIYGNIDLDTLIEKYRFCAGIQNQYHHRLIFPYCVLCITTKCSLRCKDCAAFITEYRSQEEYSLAYIKNTFGKVIDAVDEIQELELMGGEPLLHTEFNYILEWCLNQRKISAVKIITNGTIMPKEDTWKLMSNPKVKLVVDDYGKLSKCYQELLIYAQKHNVRCEEQKLQTWYGLKPIVKKQISREKHMQIFKDCYFRNCIGVTNGKFYHCNVAGHMYNAQLILDDSTDYIDLSRYDGSGKDIREEIRKYMEIDYMSACAYCNFCAGIEVPVALQEK